MLRDVQALAHRARLKVLAFRIGGRRREAVGFGETGTRLAWAFC
jgi:hypothetical protein